LLVNNNYTNNTMVQQGVKNRRILLAIAHPDDECMFFAPTIQSYVNNNDSVYVLCLSNGNAEGLGKIREKELTESCKVMGINGSNVRVVNDDRMPDGMKQVWPQQVVKQHIQSLINEWNIDHILTFDEGGVSGHPNHISVFEAVRSIIEEQGQQRQNQNELTGEKLETVNIVRKYIGIGDIAWSYLVGGATTSNSYLSWQPFGINYLAMKQHKSQFVWFRHLFVFFSRYSYINTLRNITDQVA
ncbi:hypothetical protein SAMD00019534_077150, partial [Acytostelium subglobosum LB1]|uniref:hypothetical protein n=1 Tax=Acytostelium subglobosum LB1 TaxID=1410327 RepID=UPI000644CFD3